MADELYFSYITYFVRTQLILSGIKYSYDLCLLNIMYTKYVTSKMYFFLFITLPE